MECACYFADKVSAIGLTPPGSSRLELEKHLIDDRVRNAHTVKRDETEFTPYLTATRE